MTEEIIKEVFNKAFKKHFPEAIIIDGVNISECVYCLNNKLQGKTHAPSKSMPYAKETSCIACKADITKYNFCKHNPNCYYKQLQRLKQENEELKTSNRNLKLQIETYQRPEVVKVLTDWRTGELQLQEKRENNYRSALEEIRENLVKLKTNDEDDFTYEYSKIEDKINEVLQ